jgi:hypothetical protein
MGQFTLCPQFTFCSKCYSYFQFIRLSLFLESLACNERKGLWVQFYLGRLYITDTWPICEVKPMKHSTMLSILCAGLDIVTLNGPSVVLLLFTDIWNWHLQGNGLSLRCMVVLTLKHGLRIHPLSSVWELKRSHGQLNLWLCTWSECYDCVGLLKMTTDISAYDLLRISLLRTFITLVCIVSSISRNPKLNGIFIT